MNGQTTLFDYDEGRNRSLEGMANASRADRVAMWKSDADRWLDDQPTGAEITADDLTRAVGLPDQGANRNNVLGAWFNSKARMGRLVFASRMRKSRRVDRHVGVQRVWIVR